MRSMKSTLCFTGLVLAVAASAAPVRDGYPPAIAGLIYKDVTTNVIVYVETDGRHVVAISPDGKILWRKDPFVDGGLRPYREPRPTIVHVGPCYGASELRPESGKSVCLGFSSSQSGAMDIATGVFTVGNQN